MFTYRGKTVLITGASSGIGETFAHTLAARGCNLVLVARSEEKLNTLAQTLTEKHGIQAEVIAADLTKDGAVQRVYDETQQRGLTVDMLINNAGFGTYGQFEELPLERQSDEIKLNVLSLVELTHLFLTAMLERRDGAIINVASVAGFQPLPRMAVYGATKAFVLSFTEALWGECRGRGVRVLALCPGPVETAFFDAVGSREPAVGRMSTPEDVVITGLRALERGKSFTVPGWSNYFTTMLPRFFPRQVTVLVAKWLLTPREKPAPAVRGTQGS